MPNIFVCDRPQPKPTAEDSGGLHGKKRLEHLQSQGLTGSNVCPSDAVSSGHDTMAPRHLTRIGFSSFGEWRSDLPYKPECNVTPVLPSEEMKSKNFFDTVEYVVTAESFQ